jgi:hypothetical protein
VKQEEDESTNPHLASANGHIPHGMGTDVVMQHLDTSGLYFLAMSFCPCVAPALIRCNAYIFLTEAPPSLAIHKIMDLVVSRQSTPPVSATPSIGSLSRFLAASTAG